METNLPETAPFKATISELERLRALFREALEHYGQRIDSEIEEVKRTVTSEALKPKTPHAKMRDLRDMLSILRQIQIKSDKGRRKDLKKLDALVGDLKMLVEHW
jgi:hypothetical protein